MREIELSAGTIDYEDTGGGPVVVMLHGLVMDGSVWRKVVGNLRADHRCIVPTLPLGGHRRPMRPDADLTLRGHGRLVGELLERLELRDVTLVQNDHAAALALVSECPELVSRLVISSCEAFDNYPPGLPGKNIALIARVPGGLYPAMQLMRIRALRRLPITLGWMSKRRIPDEITDAWFRPLQTQRGIRRDLAKYAAGARKEDMIEITESLRSFDRPALVVWTPEDRVMAPEHGGRLAELLPQGRLVEIPDSYTLIPEDQPEEFARAIRDFIRDTSQGTDGHNARRAERRPAPASR
jgi:pimeloyl-ACP methyl ester carboxylesterase